MLKKFYAFSLVEMLVALIVISLIAAALMPVITRKLNSSKTCELCQAGFYSDGTGPCIAASTGNYIANSGSTTQTPCNSCICYIIR